MRKHFVIGDPQCEPGKDLSFLEAHGNYILEKRPDVVVNLGDHGDIPSLSTYDKPGSLTTEGQRIEADLVSARHGNELLWQAVNNYNKRRKKHRQYNPYKVICIGNHEQRIERAAEANPRSFTVTMADLQYEKHYDKVGKFLEPIEIDGVWYSHYFANMLSGRPIGGNAHYKLTKLGFSFTMGHVQELDMARKSLQNGQTLCGLVVGASYPHDMGYKGRQGNNHFRGSVMCHEVQNGSYDPMVVSTDFLMRNYL